MGGIRGIIAEYEAEIQLHVLDEDKQHEQHVKKSITSATKNKNINKHKLQNSNDSMQDVYNYNCNYNDKNNDNGNTSNNNNDNGNNINSGLTQKRVRFGIDDES